MTVAREITSLRTPSEKFVEVTSYKTSALVQILTREMASAPTRILVVGCGAGSEAGALARNFDAETYGIDLQEEFEFDHDGAKPAKLLRMNAQALAFADESFDLVYSFHALEHISDVRSALSEMARVLRRSGTYCIGTPNRARLVGYLGSGYPLHKKLAWNAMDWSMRIRGRWSNEQGAHAGFYAAELNARCMMHFGSVNDITDDYYVQLYGQRMSTLRKFGWRIIAPCVVPCVYVLGTKRRG
jgi:ubiquinone/menaquinone biosynthesis C-methylase UbiE